MQQLTTTALLSVIILLSGAMKIPSPFPGGEFQLSAPLAVLICVCFGFKRYLTAGIIASLLGLLLGTANVLNVIIAMTFRVVAGGIVSVSKGWLPLVILSGPAGTALARFVLAGITGVDLMLLLTAAIPGMIFTALATGGMYKPAMRFCNTYLYGKFSKIG